jgi:hypothetical protein
VTAPIDGGWLAIPLQGARAGEGGDCFGVAYFGDDELAALRYANQRDLYRAIYILPGQTVLDAWERQQ